MIKAIAFDPGVTTGFATGEIEENEPMLVQTSQAQLTHADIMLWLTDYKPDYIICENFTFRQSPASANRRTGLELISKEFIGIINLFCQMNPDCTLVMQQPGMVLNGYWSPEKLKKLHLYRKGMIHANEACMHLLYTARFGVLFQYCKGEIRAKDELKSNG